MVPVSLLWEASLSMAALLSAGACGLRMCRAMLRCKTSSSLRREADIGTLQLAKSCSLSTHQRAAVLRALYEFEPLPDRLRRPARSRGHQHTRIQRSPSLLSTSINCSA